MGKLDAIKEAKYKVFNTDHLIDVEHVSKELSAFHKVDKDWISQYISWFHQMKLQEENNLSTSKRKAWSTPEKEMVFAFLSDMKIEMSTQQSFEALSFLLGRTARATAFFYYNTRKKTQNQTGEGSSNADSGEKASETALPDASLSRQFNGNHSTDLIDSVGSLILQLHSLEPFKLMPFFEGMEQLIKLAIQNREENSRLQEHVKQIHDKVSAFESLSSAEKISKIKDHNQDLLALINTFQREKNMPD